MTKPLIFAVPKGRILDEALPVMARAGLVPEDAFHDKGNRSLTFATTRDDARLIRVSLPSQAKLSARLPLS